MKKENKTLSLIGGLVVVGAISALVAKAITSKDLLENINKAKETSKDFIDEADKKIVVYEMNDTEEGTKLSQISK